MRAAHAAPRFMRVHTLTIYKYLLETNVVTTYGLPYKPVVELGRDWRRGISHWRAINEQKRGHLGPARLELGWSVCTGR